MLSIAGFVQIVPAHATVIKFASSRVEPQLTNTAGAGYTIVPGFHTCLAITKLVL
jgi:hypothetical protein